MISVTTEFKHKFGNVYRNQTSQAAAPRSRLVGGHKAPLSWFALCQSNPRKRKETKQLTGKRQRGVNKTASYASGAENRRRPKEKRKAFAQIAKGMFFFKSVMQRLYHIAAVQFPSPGYSYTNDNQQRVEK